MAKFISAAKKFLSRTEGASLVEYGLLVALIAIVCIAGVSAVGNKAQAVFTNIAAALGG
jgi:pilus assembly protein Flp/PilA